MPGPPRGPSLRITITSPATIRPSSTAWSASLLALEDARRPAVGHPLVPGDLHDAALGREVAPEDHQPARLLQRLVDRPHHVLPRRLDGR